MTIMDPRVERHAEILVEHSVHVKTGDMVQVVAPAYADDLVVALYEKLGEIGAQPRLSWINSRANQTYLQAIDPDDVVTAEHALAAMEETDVHIVIRGHENTAEHSDTPSETSQATARSGKPIRDTLPDRDVITQYPAPGDAQQAEMSTEAYKDFVWDAINQDWTEQRAFQKQLVEILNPAGTVRIQSGAETDLTMSIAGMNAVNGHARGNLPDGEVFTAPVFNSVEGTVRFDYPVQYAGREIEGVFLEFEGGAVVSHHAENNKDALTGLLETDEGARHLGELGIGMNRDIDRFTHNTLFDEKMGGTIHLAVGTASDQSVPEDAEGNDSAVHVDMLVDMRENAIIEVDGTIVQRNGIFRFEDEFEGNQSNT